MSEFPAFDHTAAPVHHKREGRYVSTYWTLDPAEQADEHGDTSHVKLTVTHNRNHGKYRATLTVVRANFADGRHHEVMGTSLVPATIIELMDAKRFSEQRFADFARKAQLRVTQGYPGHAEAVSA